MNRETLRNNKTKLRSPNNNLIIYSEKLNSAQTLQWEIVIKAQNVAMLIQNKN